MRVLASVATALMPLLLGAGAAASELRVTIRDVASSSGTVMIGLYNSEEHFLTAIAKAANVGLLNNEARLVGIAMRAVAGTQSAVFTNLKPGNYAVIVFHDENDNGKLDETSWGAPIEGYGFSNNAEGFFAPPSFGAAAVMLDDHDRTVDITLKYPRSKLHGAKPD